MFRDDKALRIIVVFMIAVSLCTSSIAYASQTDTGDTTNQVNYKTVVVQTGEYYEKSALKDVEINFLRNDILTIDQPEGTFVQYLITNNQQVKEGDPLLSYQIPSDRIGVDEKKLQLKQNESAYQESQKQKEKEIDANKQKLYTMDNSSIEAQILQLNIRKMESAYEQYQYQTEKSINELKTAIKELESDMELQYIYAPYDGVVFIDDKIKEGTLLNQGTRLIYIYDIKSAVLGTSVKEISKLWYDMEVSVTGISNMKEDTANIHKGKIIAVDSLYNGKASTGMIYIQLDNTEELISSIQKANITSNSVSVDHVLIIPLSVVKKSDDMKYVFVLDADGVIRKQYITGRDNGVDMWVYSGLSEGQQIVVE
ncbi:MAG TPA: hypothetical protein VN258_19095 [Mobilitalea sp.]|nr:hypothetical protein [Mobilitalea sp.]